jgi:hypothetical protein
MKKFILVLVLLLAFTCYGQMPSTFIDVSVGTGHLWTGSGNYYAGNDSRELDYQLSAKWVSTSGWGAYAGYTHDGIKLGKWLVKHNFIDLNLTDYKNLECLDIGGLYVLKGDKIDGFASIGFTGYKALGDEALGWYVLVGSDVQIYKHLFLTLKAEYRSNAKNFEAMQSSAFETGVLLTYRF